MQSIRSIAQQAMETLAYLYFPMDSKALDSSRGKNVTLDIIYRSSLAILSLSLTLGVWDSGNVGLAVIKQGDRSLQVQGIQERLQDLGYFPRTPTGYFGPITRNAIVQFQQAQGLIPDGVVGIKTQAALGNCPYLKTHSPQKSPQTPNSLPSTIAPFYPVSPEPIAQNTTSNRLELGSSGEEVEALQQRLDLLGYYQGEITGEFDESTQQAVTAFQRDRRLVADGVVGNQTRRALQNPLPREQVIALQQRLKNVGLYNGVIDGVWGPITQRAIEAAQKTYGISASDLLN